MEDTLVGKNEQGALEIDKNPSRQDLLQGIYQRIARRNEKNALIGFQKRFDERNFDNQFPLLFFDLFLVIASVVRKHDIPVDGQVEDIRSQHGYHSFEGVVGRVAEALQPKRCVSIIKILFFQEKDPDQSTQECYADDKGPEIQ